MKRIAFLNVVIALLAAETLAGQQAAQPLKVFISVDMEGIAGVASSTDVGGTTGDYARFRTIMATEANAAIDGAFRAGAAEVLVRDSHGSKLNMFPADLDPRARLLRAQSSGPKNMMEGIDSTFGAAVFIGYHAKAGTASAILEHTSTGNVVDFSINGVSLPEGGYNALVAGLYGVPVVFASGDRAVVEQLRGLLGPIDAVAVKEDVGGASLGMSPERAQAAIREGVERAVRNRARFKPYKLASPYTMVLKVKEDRALYNGATRTTPLTTTFSNASLLEILSAFNAMK